MICPICKGEGHGLSVEADRIGRVTVDVVPCGKCGGRGVVNQDDVICNACSRRIDKNEYYDNHFVCPYCGAGGD